MPARVCAFLLWRAAGALRPGNPPRPRAATARRAEAAPGPAPPLGGGRGVPLGPPAAASEPGYERWISSQLRTNRIQDATRGLKDKVVDALRRRAALEDVLGPSVVGAVLGPPDRTASNLSEEEDDYVDAALATLCMSGGSNVGG